MLTVVMGIGNGGYVRHFVFRSSIEEIMSDRLYVGLLRIYTPKTDADYNIIIICIITPNYNIMHNNTERHQPRSMTQHPLIFREIISFPGQQKDYGNQHDQTLLHRGKVYFTLTIVKDLYITKRLGVNY